MAEWIPCIERMPEKRDGKYLVSVDGKVYYSNDAPTVFGGTWYIVDLECYTVEYFTENVDAWMPLPKPFKT